VFCCPGINHFKFTESLVPPGVSALVIPPDAVFPCDLGDVDGFHKRDKTLDELHQNILRFIYAYAPGAAAYITEE